MGFWDTLGTVAGNALNEQKKKAERAKFDAERWDDSKLIKRFQEEKDFVKKATYAQELKNRGYKQKAED